MAKDPSPTGRPGALTYGYALTVDTAQGSTATEHGKSACTAVSAASAMAWPIVTGKLPSTSR